MYIKIALRNIRVHWKQSLAAFFSISAAFFCFVLFQGYMLDVQGLYLDGYRNRSMYGDFIIENKLVNSAQAQKDIWKYALSKADQEAINSHITKNADKIFSSVRFLDFQGLISTGSSSKIFLGQSYDIVAGEKMRENWKWNVLYGLPLYESQISNPILLGQTLGHQLGCDPEKKIYSLLPNGGYAPANRAFNCRRTDLQLSVTTPAGNLNASDFEVAGIIDGGYKDIDSRFLQIKIEDAQKLLNTELISYWTIKLNQGVDSKKWITKLNAEFTKNHPHLHAIDWRDHQAGELYIRTMDLLNIFRNFVTIVVAFISTLSVMNTMVKIVNERTREIGTLLSMGFRRSYILKIFMTESLFLGLIGTTTGALSALVCAGLLNTIGIHYKAGLLSEPVPFRILANPSLYFFAFSLLVLITLLASYVSCRSTINKKIVECLGHV